MVASTLERLARAAAVRAQRSIRCTARTVYHRAGLMLKEPTNVGITVDTAKPCRC